jgi:hypothetical protein
MKRAWSKTKECKDDERRAKRKELIDRLGGKCQFCGYNKCEAALDFHHRDDRTKRFNVASGMCRSMEDLIKETNKCLLLCANCHRELHLWYNKYKPK